MSPPSNRCTPRSPPPASQPTGKPGPDRSAFRHDRFTALTLLDEALAARLRAAQLTYSEVGRTANVPPAGYRHQRRTVTIGSGADTFAGAANALLSWQVQLRAGLRVCASAPRAEPGVVLILGLGAGPVRLSAPCRVVYA